MQIDDLFYEALLARDNEMMSTCGHKHNISLMECYDVIPFYAKYRLQPETHFKCLLRKALEWLVKLTDVKDFTALEHFDITCAFRNHPQRVMNIVRKNLAPQLSEGRILQIEFARRVGAIVHSLMYTRLFHLGIHFNVTAREDEDRAIRDFSCKVFHAYMGWNRHKVALFSSTNEHFVNLDMLKSNLVFKIPRIDRNWDAEDVALQLCELYDAYRTEIEVTCNDGIKFVSMPSFMLASECFKVIINEYINENNFKDAFNALLRISCPKQAKDLDMLAISAISDSKDLYTLFCEPYAQGEKPDLLIEKITPAAAQLVGSYLILDEFIYFLNTSKRRSLTGLLGSPLGAWFLNIIAACGSINFDESEIVYQILAALENAEILHLKNVQEMVKPIETGTETSMVLLSHVRWILNEPSELDISDNMKAFLTGIFRTMSFHDCMGWLLLDVPATSNFSDIRMKKQNAMRITQNQIFLIADKKEIEEQLRKLGKGWCLD